MRLLVIAKHLLDPRDAQAQQSAALLAALSAAASIDVITGSFTGPVAPTSVPDSVRLHALPARWPTYRQNLPAKIARKLVRNLSASFSTRWARQAAQTATRLMAVERYDAFVSIALPMESHIAALYSRRRAPWIACMSDPWPESILPAPYSDLSLPIIDTLQQRIVRKTFESADALVFPCQEELEYLASHYPTLDKGKAFLIPHVGSGNVSTQLAHVDRSDDLVLVHGGALSRERVCVGLAQALGALPQNSRWRLRLVGRTHPEMLFALDQANAMQRVDVDGWKPRAETLGILSSADALLLIEAQMSSYPFLPSKLADYASTGKPILAITGHESASTRLIDVYRAGLSCAHDARAILQALLDMEARHGEFSSRELACVFTADRVVAAYRRIVALLDESASSAQRTASG